MWFGLPRTQKTAAPAPANQNTGRETAPARLIWWGTVSSVPGWQENDQKKYYAINYKYFVLPLAGLSGKKYKKLKDIFDFLLPAADMHLFYS